MTTSIEERFMRQQGFAPENPARLRSHFRALLFQPFLVGPLMVIAVVFQSRGLFFALAAVLT